MIEMFRASFSQYGHCVSIPRKAFLTGYDWQIKAYLDNSFRFLIPKPQSPPLEPALLYSFTAGLSDSDGCWSVRDSRGRTAFKFDVTSNNSDLLSRLASSLEKEGYHPHLYRSQSKGTIKLVKGRDENKWITLTQDIWTLVISRKDKVKRLAYQVLPYSRHQEKISKMKLFLDNQNEDWEEMKPKFEQLRHHIKSETNETISRAEIEYKARHREVALGVVG
jgi:LAGLIDADG-like domain